MKIKTSELQGAALDWATATCEGATGLRFDTVACWWFTLNGIDRVLSKGWSSAQNYAPSTDWAQGGPIIDRDPMAFEIDEDMTTIRAYYPFKQGESDGAGPTHLIAAMRCYVASKLGAEIDVPEQLVERI